MLKNRFVRNAVDRAAMPLPEIIILEASACDSAFEGKSAGTAVGPHQHLSPLARAKGEV